MIRRASSVLLCVALVGCSQPPQSATSAQSYRDDARIDGSFLQSGAKPSAAGEFKRGEATLHYEVYGSGEPLLLMGSGIDEFRMVIDQFRGRYQVIAMDNRDWGASTDTPDPISYRTIADDYSALLTELNLAGATVVGWNAGATAALLLTLRHPEKVKNLVFFDADQKPHEELRAFIDEYRERLDRGLVTWQAKRHMKWVELLLTDPGIDLSELKQISVPTLILTTDRRTDILDQARQIHGRISNSQLLVFAGVNATFPYDDPKRFHEAIESFVSPTSLATPALPK